MLVVKEDIAQPCTQYDPDFDPDESTVVLSRVRGSLSFLTSHRPNRYPLKSAVTYISPYQRISKPKRLSAIGSCHS